MNLLLVFDGYIQRELNCTKKEAYNIAVSTCREYGRRVAVYRAIHSYFLPQKIVPGNLLFVVKPSDLSDHDK